MSIKERLEKIKQSLKRATSETKNKTIALGLTGVFLATSLFGCAGTDDVKLAQLEEKLSNAEAQVELLEDELHNVTVENYKNEIAAYKEKTQELEEALNNASQYATKEDIAVVKAQLSKIEALLEGIQSGALTGEDLDGAINAIQNELSKQSATILEALQNSNKAPSIDTETQAPSQDETQAPSQDETQKPSQDETQNPSQDETQKPSQDEILQTHPTDGIENLQSTEAVVEKILTNLEKINVELLSQSVTDYETLFAQLKDLENKINNNVFTEEYTQTLKTAVYNTQLNLIQADIKPEFDATTITGYSEVNGIFTSSEYPSERMVAGIDLSTGRNFSKSLDTDHISIFEDGYTQYVTNGQYEKYDDSESAEFYKNFSSYMVDQSVGHIQELLAEGDILDLNIQIIDGNYEVDFVSKSDFSGSPTKFVIDQENVSIGCTSSYDGVNSVVSYDIDTMEKEDFEKTYSEAKQIIDEYAKAAENANER